MTLKRCKSSPGLIEASMNQSGKDLKRCGTLPTSLLKRTDISLLISNNNTSTKSAEALKKADKSKPPVVLNISPPPPPPPTSNPTIKTVNEETTFNNSITKYNEKKPILPNDSTSYSPQNSLLNYITNKDTHDTNQTNVNSNALLIQEIANLKNYIHLLETEKNSLNLRLENPSGLNQRNNTTNTTNTSYTTNNLVANKKRIDSESQLRAESKYIHRDPFKV